MPISELELADLKSRTANAIRTNSSVANVEGHIEALESMVGKSGVARVKVSDTRTKYLYQLILQAEIQGTEPPAPVRAPEPPPVIEVVEVVEEAPVIEEPQAKGSPEKSKSKKDKKKY